jgi:hypothetical protein
MKKGWVLAFLLGAAALLAVLVGGAGTASAYYMPNVRYAAQSMVDFYVNAFEPVLQALFGGYGWSGLYLFERLLLFLVVMSVVYVAVSRVNIFEGRKALQWIVTLAVSIMSIRFMNYEWLEAVLSQYPLLGVVIGSILPFLIYFYFIYSAAGDHGVIRKIGWGIFAAIYIGLWSGANNEANSMVYFWTVVASLVLLFGDNIIHRRFMALDMIKKNKWFVNDEVTRINAQIQKLNEGIINKTNPNPGYARQQIRELESHKKWLLKQ